MIHAVNVEIMGDFPCFKNENPLRRCRIMARTDLVFEVGKQERGVGSGEALPIVRCFHYHPTILISGSKI